VHSHIRTIYSKLHVNNRKQALRQALSRGYVRADTPPRTPGIPPRFHPSAGIQYERHTLAGRLTFAPRLQITLLETIHHP
jgi:hypothetical protein